jgi:pilus assembly protein CpaB
MNRGRILLGLGLALVVAFLASRYVYVQLRQAQTAAAGKPMKLAKVVVAAGPLKMGQRLGADDLKLVEWPADKQPKGTFSRKEDCVGRALIAPIAEDEAILEQKLAPREAGAGLSAAIPLGMRAVSVGVDDVVAVAGFVTPGTLVDVMVTGAGPGGPVTRTILEHLRVLAVGQQLQADSNGKPQTAPVVTLLVTPEEAQRLTLAAAEGRIHLALRNAVDTANANPLPVQGVALFQGGALLPVGRKIAPKAGRRAPPPPYKVQVIQGEKVETQTFPQ